MNTAKISAMLSFAAMVLMATDGKAQIINTKTISLDAAKKVVTEAVKYGKANNAPGGAIAIVDNGGNLVYLERIDGTFPAASEVAIKKANTAATFKAPSSKLENAINGGRQALITVGHTC
jgi:glc operon protein GlcG